MAGLQLPRFTVDFATYPPLSSLPLATQEQPRYSSELERTIRWLLKAEPSERPTVEDLLNLPYVSMRLREKALTKNMAHLRKRQDDVQQKDAEVKRLEASLKDKERELLQRESQLEEQERAVYERLKKNSSGDGSTNPGTDLGNDSCIKNGRANNAGGAGPIFNQSIDRAFFTSPAPQNTSNERENINPNVMQ